jgi:hypothetical protein
MAEKQDNNTQQDAGGQQQSAPQRQVRPCPKDCTKCGYQQHAFCAARMSFQMFDVLNNVIQRLDVQSQHIADLEQRIAAIQSSEAEFISPQPLEGNLFQDAE